MSLRFKKTLPIGGKPEINNTKWFDDLRKRANFKLLFASAFISNFGEKVQKNFAVA